MSDFLIIAVTRPDFFEGEANMINNLIESGEVDYVHIRKPEADISQIENLILEIQPNYLKKIKIHDHFSLVDKYPLGGIHLNSRNRDRTVSAKSISKSLHSLNEIEETTELDYFFISPVFDSISKKGYKAAFNLDELSEKIRGKKAVALGGVTTDRIPLLKSMGFYGAALLSHFFPG